MRIDSAPYVVDLSRSQAARRPSEETKAVQETAQPAKARASQERVEISPRARELAQLKLDLEELPEVRLDRVALAKQTMQYGEYRVDPEVLARRMMESFATVA